MNHHEAAAAEIAGARIGDSQRKTDCDSGVDGIAAHLENIDADPGGARFLRHHHAVAGGDRFAGGTARSVDSSAGPLCPTDGRLLQAAR